MRASHLEELACDEPGSVELFPLEVDDLWCAYNIILPGDLLTASTVRKVVRVSPSGTKDVQRISLTLQIKVQTLHYDSDASVLRLQGKNLSEKHHMALGQSHTIELRLRTPFTLHKDAWDSAALDALRYASCLPDAAPATDLAVVLMQEGLAHVLRVSRSITTTCSRVSVPIPRKHVSAAAGAYQTALHGFFDAVLRCTLRSVDFDAVRCLVIASPGFTKDQFRDYLLAEAERRQLKEVLVNKASIVVAHAASGYKHSLPGVLADPGVMALIKQTTAGREVRALSEFMSVLRKDPDRACYGPRHVEVARERAAIQSLLITDGVFRSADTEARRRHIELVKSVEAAGGDVYVFSSMHASGEQLAQMTGIAAILRFPLPELDDIEM